MIEGRPYQLNNVDFHFDIAGRGQRPISCAPTGSGKTVIQALIADEEMKRGHPTAILTPRFEIFNQTHSMLSQVCGWSNIASLRSGDQWNRSKPIHLVSWPTLTSRTKRSKAWFPDVATVLVDEAHLSMAPRIHEALEYLAPKATVHGYTATPARQTGKGLGRFYTEIKHVVSVRQLIREGFLAPCEYWAGLCPDTRGVPERGGDWQAKPLAKRAVLLVGDVIDNWLRLAADRHTLVFGVDIAHAEALAARFNDVGVSAACIHNRTSSDQRAEIVEKFRARTYQVLTNVTIASYGFDCPSIDCLVLARPTKSIVLHLQSVGRGMRPDDGKSECMVLDHAGNTDRLGQASDLFRWRLEAGSSAVKNWTRMEESGESDSQLKTCVECGYLFERSRVCPKCGWQVPFARRDVDAVDADLVRISEDRTQPLGEEWPTHEEFYRMLVYYAKGKEYTYPRGWAAHKYRAKTKKKNKPGLDPDPQWDVMVAIPPTQRVLNWIHKQQQNYARRVSYARKADKEREAIGTDG